MTIKVEVNYIFTSVIFCRSNGIHVLMYTYVYFCPGIYDFNISNKTV